MKKYQICVERSREMKVVLTIKEGSLETEVTLIGYRLMVEALLEAIKEAARKQSQFCEIQ